MNENQLDQLKYPIGKLQFSPAKNQEETDRFIEIIEQFPSKVKEAIADLHTEQLDWIYRPGGWSIKQLIHHCADSHMNAFIRFKLALTEEQPTIKPYIESLWAKLPDTTNVDISHSIKILEGLHYRWNALLRSLKATDYQKTIVHPEYDRIIKLDVNLQLYAWHCAHHLAHIKQAINHKGSF